MASPRRPSRAGPASATLSPETLPRQSSGLRAGVSPCCPWAASFCHNVTTSSLAGGGERGKTGSVYQNSIHCVCLQTRMSHAQQPASRAKISAETEPAERVPVGGLGEGARWKHPASPAREMAAEPLPRSLPSPVRRRMAAGRLPGPPQPSGAAAASLPAPHTGPGGASARCRQQQAQVPLLAVLTLVDSAPPACPGGMRGRRVCAWDSRQTPGGAGLSGGRGSSLAKGRTG